MSEGHVCAGVNRRFLVAGFWRTDRKPQGIGTATKAAEAVANRGYRKTWVNCCADCYDPVTILTVKAEGCNG